MWKALTQPQLEVLRRARLDGRVWEETQVPGLAAEVAALVVLQLLTMDEQLHCQLTELGKWYLSEAPKADRALPSESSEPRSVS